MNSRIKKAILPVIGLVLAPAVIGRYGDSLAGILRTEVLLGFGAVATLVALIILEYRNGTARSRRLAYEARRSEQRCAVPTPAIVPFSKRRGDGRAAA